MKLKRCPFCGGGPIWIYDPAGERDGSEDRWNLSCDTCGITFEEGFRNRKDAIEAWNRRVATDMNVGDKERTAKVDWLNGEPFCPMCGDRLEWE